MTPKIPVTVLAGAMGAGKTTLINRIVSESGQRILVIQNELGEVTVEGAPIISTDEEIFDMDDGLVCGTVRGDLIRALVSITRRREQYDRILIEATGPGGPGPIVRTFLMDQEIQRSFRLDGLAMLVDGRLLSLYTEGKTGGHEQIVFANVLIVNKTDLVSPGEVARDGALAALGEQHRARPQHQLRQPAARAAARTSTGTRIDRALGRGTRPSDIRIPAQQRPSAARMAAAAGTRCRPRRRRAGASTSASSRARSRGATAPPSWRSATAAGVVEVRRASDGHPICGARCTRAPSTRSPGSPAQARIATAGEDGAVRILQLGADEPVTVVRPGAGRSTADRLEPEGRHAGGREGRRRASSSAPTASSCGGIPAVDSTITGLTWSPDGGGDRVLVLRRRARHRSEDGRAPAPPARARDRC